MARGDKSVDVTIFPRRLQGTVTPPPSKSMAHRVVLAELLSGKDIFSVSADLSEDIRATVACAKILRGGGNLSATEKENGGNPGNNTLPVLDCGESGSTLRFLIPVALALHGGGVFTGRGRLMERPQTPYFDLFHEKGIQWKQAGNVLTVRGCLTPGEYQLPGNVSSQFITGLLFALPLLDGNSVVRLTSPLESAAYVDMTLDVLNQCGVTVRRPDPKTFLIPGNQHYQAENLSVEADWSQAAFWYAANFLGNDIAIRGLNPSSVQGDREIAALYQKMDTSLSVEIDLSGIPDLLPPLAAMAAGRSDLTRFSNAGRLRLKESDRLETVSRLLSAFAVKTEIGSDWLEVYGGISNSTAEITIDGSGDHRIVMAAAVLASIWSAPVTIRGAEAVNKSYPSFFDDYQRLGGKIRVL